MMLPAEKILAEKAPTQDYSVGIFADICDIKNRFAKYYLVIAMVSHLDETQSKKR